jgi:hypothetical protein
MLKWIRNLGLVAIGILGILWAWYKADLPDPRVSSPPPGPTPTIQNPTSAPVPDTSEWVVVKEWSGTGSQKTGPIFIDSNVWTVSVVFTKAEPDAFFFYTSLVRPGRPGSPDEPILSTSDPQGAETFVYESGTFALDINGTNCSWIVSVFAPKPK